MNLFRKIIYKVKVILERGHLFFRANECRKEDEIIDPIIFMNTPIVESEKDVIGIQASVNAIEDAIKDGAKMIGVIAEYGTGKTSLTELLIKRRKNSKVIRINLWDTLSDNLQDDKSINHLTKSFIYQLAMGKSFYRADHVNKILNDNYGVIAFSTGLVRTWIFLGIAGVLETLYLICENISFETLRTLLALKDKVWKFVISDISPVFQLLAVVFVILALLDASVAYSHWKNESKRITDIGEVFSAYSYVHRCLRSFGKPCLVVIEDLDRIEERKKIIDFLKELYRFNNLCHARYRKNPVFLIAIAPESKLKERKSTSKSKTKEIQDVQENIYSKVFDYMVSLKPIHYDDYKTVLQEILDSEPDKKNRLNAILNDREKLVNGKISEAFAWLYRGDNLTLRTIKERLNQAVELYIELQNKQYVGNASINFRTCVCVTYLEDTYGKKFYELVKDEKMLANIIQESYLWRNNKLIRSLEDYESEVNKIYNRAKISRDIAELIYLRILDADYRMYFYSFPKGSYIKNIDEKDVCNYIEYPHDYSYEYNDLNEKMTRLKKKKRLNKIVEAICHIATSPEIDRYPKVVYEDGYMFRVAYLKNKWKCAESLALHLLWDEEYKEEIRILKMVKEYLKNEKLNKSETSSFWGGVCDSFIDIDCDMLTFEDIVDIRKILISIFGEDILYFNKLYMGNEENPFAVPCITKPEINMINDFSVSIKLIDVRKFSLETLESLYEFFEKPLNDEQLDIAIILFKALYESVSFEECGDFIYHFMLVNKILVNEFFDSLCDWVKKDEFPKYDFIKYLNLLDSNDYKDENLRKINELELDNSLDERIVQLILNLKYYALPLKYYCEKMDLQKIDFKQKHNEIIEACKYIDNDDVIRKIRYEIIKQYNGEFPEEYNVLFFDDYPIVSIEELKAFNKFEDAMFALKGTELNFSNVEEYLEFINTDIHEEIECYAIFESLVCEENLGCADSEVVKMIIDNLDYEKVKMMSLSDAQMEEIMQWLNVPLKVSIIDNAIQLMKQMDFVCQKYEELILSKQGEQKYIEFINDINICTDYTINWIINSKHAYRLNTNITKRLLEDRHFEQYVIGTVLFNNEFEYPMEEVSNEVLKRLYYVDSPIFIYLSSCRRFLQMLVDEKEYINFKRPIDVEMITPFYYVPQTADLVEFVMNNFSDKEVETYLYSFKEIKSRQESIDIAKLLLRNIKYLVDKRVYMSVKNKLWENTSGYKAALTKKRNEYILKSAGKKSNL